MTTLPTPPLLFQRADGERGDPGWVHLDCSGPDREATVAVVEALGGRVVDRRSDSHGSGVVLADPEGNVFCTEVPRGSSGGVRLRAGRQAAATWACATAQSSA